MDIAAHVAALRRDGPLMARAAEDAGLDADVPTCPGWRVRDLLGHLGGVHRWATSYVATGNLQPTPDAEEAGFFTAPSDPDLVGWFREGHAALVSALSTADPGLRCWTFLNAASPLAFWARRQAHETAIHRVDAEAVAARLTACDPEFAADGIDELFNGFMSRPAGRLVADPPVSLGVHAADVDVAWTLHIGPERRWVVDGADAADLILTGPAHDLYLMLWNRRDAGGLDFKGDQGVLDLWRERVRISWS